MNIVADLFTGQIIQVIEREGASINVNGKFIPAIPDIAPVSMDETAYITPIDGNDVISRAMANMLVQFPMYGHVLFNPLLTASDVAQLDLTASYGAYPTRAAVGRGAGPLPVGQSPNRTRILRANPVTSDPGVLITDTIDISLIVPAGVDEVLVWWKLDSLSRTDDVSSSYGATAGENDPCLVSLATETTEPAGFEVYASNDDGVTWYSVGYLSPVDLINMGTDIRLAFINTSNFDIRISGFAILF